MKERSLFIFWKGQLNFFMAIKLAKTAGFCMGVRRAVSIALRESQDGGTETYTYGPLIHNEQTIKLLEARNIFILNDPGDVEGGFSGKTTPRL